MVFVCAYLRYSFSKFVHDKKKEDKNKQKTGEKKRKRKREREKQKQTKNPATTGNELVYEDMYYHIYV